MIFGIEVESFDFEADRAELLKRLQAEADLASKILGTTVEIARLP